MKLLHAILVSAFTLSPLCAQADPAGEKVAAQMRAQNVGYGDMSATLTMTLRDKCGGSAVRVMQVRSKERPTRDVGDYSLVVFQSPRDVKGMALLSHSGVLQSDEQWLYLPATKRVRRISTNNASGPFVGSEFAYEDITGTEVGKFSWELKGEGPCPRAEGTCYRLESHAKYEGSGYTHRLVWVDKEAYRVHKIEFFDRRGAPLKTLTYSKWNRHKGRFWRADRWIMKNLQNGKSTELSFADVSFDNGFEDSDFHRSALKRVR